MFTTIRHINWLCISPVISAVQSGCSKVSLFTWPVTFAISPFCCNASTKVYKVQWQNEGSLTVLYKMRNLKFKSPPTAAIFAAGNHGLLLADAQLFKLSLKAPKNANRWLGLKFHMLLKGAVKSLSCQIISVVP